MSRSPLLVFIALCLLRIPCLYAGNVPLPSYPLAVRSPYLSAWLPGNESSNAPTAQPTFWSGLALHWVIISRVNSEIYCLLGCSPGGSFSSAKSAQQTSIDYTSTHTYINLNAGPATFILDFFSPVSPRYLLRHSFPYSYLTVQASGADVQVYTSIDDSWYGIQGTVAPRVSSTNNGTTYFELNDTDAKPFKESSNSELAAWGSVVLASRPSSSSRLTSQCGSDSEILSSFSGTGSLSNSQSCKAGDSWAIAHDMGSLSGSSAVTFAIGQQRYETVLYQEETQISYIYSKYKSVADTVDAFLDDMTDAVSESLGIDNSIRQSAEGISSNYADICEATVRQVFGAMEITVNGQTKDPINPWIWNKEISSGGKVDSVDVLYSTFPILFVLNPYWIKWLLDPVLQFVVSPEKWSQQYIVHDLGSPYPMAIRNQDADNAEKIQILTTGAFFTLLLAYQQATGDTAWVQPHIPTLTRFANYLNDQGPSPPSQLSTVDAIGARPNRTDLAIQAAVGLKAFGILSGMQNFTDAGTSLANMLYNDGVGLDSGRTHFTFQFGVDNTWIIIFNAFDDKVLDLQLFPDEAWAMQSAFYSKQITPEGLAYAGGGVDCGQGLGLGTDLCNWAVTDWNNWAGSTCDSAVGNEIIDRQHSFITGGTASVPLPSRYYVSGYKKGEYYGTRARSTVGANFAILALAQTYQYPGSVGTGPGGSGVSASVAGRLGVSWTLVLMASTAVLQAHFKLI